jgi:TIR domain-containing protein
MTDAPCAGVRAFISYSHADHEPAGRIARWLSGAGGWPIWDAQLRPGGRFREDLLTFIGNAHVFVALLTDASIKRPWVLQEMGYAAALSIPIVPVSTGPLPEGLIGDLHALILSPDWSNLEQSLATVDWLGLRDVQVREPNTVLATLARSSFDRVKLLVTYAQRVQSFGSTGILRERAGLSTFPYQMHP